ncbi:MAG: hypothetical protein J6K18_01540 [Bacilli bacterium]|nr:hypothetical protein [Bacilli bacterium]
MKKILVSILLFVFLSFLSGCNMQLIELSDGYYNGELVCQHIAVSSWVTDINIKIENNNLFIDNDKVGKINSVELSDSILNFEKLSYANDYESELKELEKVKNGYYVKDTTFLDDSGEIYIVENNGKMYLFIIYKSGFNDYEILKGYYLNDVVKLNFTDYSGGCIIMQHQEEVKIGSKYDLTMVKELLFVDAFIDLETLTIYTDYITPTKNIELISYNNGVYDDYIIEYIIKNEELEFSNGFYTLEEFKKHQYQINEDEVIIVCDNVTYKFGKSYQLSECYYLKEIISNKTLFDDLNKARNDLDILFGNSTYDCSLIQVELSENGFVIKLSEHFLAG